MQRAYYLAALFIVVLGGSLGAFLFVSLLPHFTLVGWLSVSVVFVAMGCLIWLMIAFTYNRVVMWRADRQQKLLLAHVIAVEGVVSYYDGTTWEHLSARHEAAKLAPLQLASPRVVVEEVDYSIAQILEYWEEGQTLENIVEATGIPYNQVQKITSECANNNPEKLKRHNINRSKLAARR